MTLLKRLFFVLIHKKPSSILKDFKTMTDEELVDKIGSSQNPLLFSTLYDRYSKKIYNKCYSFTKNEEEAKDLTQDVFLKLFTKLHTFKGNSKFSTWLYAFTYNFCINYLKRDPLRKMESLSDTIEKHEYHLFENEDVNDEQLFEIKVSKLEKILNTIDPEDKAILLLKYQDEISVKDLQVILNIGESAVKMRLKRAKIKVVQAHNKMKL
ncbi:RNA polymerase sigma factor [Aquimarina muelleri]|uniref:RNA polymerase subunit sigma n=1 Tax=Aquimarina muelleri TaxID=279356 RepID=A0A918K0H4_9FLAO|nr:RNA polymerase sigma factor [Aquimarina muelleri]MCX2763679.1 RNA polymerase sigma factor [Aquimarina muelleri]GGX30283.1 RNA polymerase subunit sigma [Aquimarina muelleri]